MLTTTAAARPLGILGTGSAAPSRVVTNDEAGAAAGVGDAWIHAKTAIRQRRWAKPDEATGDLAVQAARAALEDAGLRARDLSLIVLGTSTPDSPQPATACFVADELGIGRGTAAFDVNAVCSGFAFALATAEGLLRASGGAGRALVIGADVYSRILDPADRRTVVLFGDGAGAVVLGPVRPESGRGLIASRLASFGAERELVGVAAGGSRLPASAQTLARGEHRFTMNGRGVRDFVAAEVAPAVTRFLADCGVRPADLAHFVPHQGNGRMLEELAAALGIPADRTRGSFAAYGNTGAASVPLTLDLTARSGALAAGDLVLLAAFGGGMTMGLTLLRW